MSKKPKNVVPLKASKAIRDKRGRNAWMRSRYHGDFTPQPGAVVDQPSAPIEWTDEATQAFWTGYGSVRQFPGCRDLYRAGVAGLRAAWAAQGLPPVPTWTPNETHSLWCAMGKGFLRAEPPHWWRHHETAGMLNAALAALPQRVVPMISREELRTRRRQATVEAAAEVDANWRSRVRMRLKK